MTNTTKTKILNDLSFLRTWAQHGAKKNAAALREIRRAYGHVAEKIQKEIDFDERYYAEQKGGE
jgi:hypothetical protein